LIRVDEGRRTMRRLDWFLAAVIGAFLVACVAAQAMSQVVVGVMDGATASRQSFVQRLVSPNAEPISVQCPIVLRRLARPG
jgi:hypothetical protein